MPLLCDEPVLKTYRMQTGTGDEELWEQLDYSKDHAIIYHAKPGYWLVLETEHYYFTIGADGLKKYVSPEEVKDSGRQIWNDLARDVERVVFPGERIYSVEDHDDGWDICFDDFMLRVVPHKEDDGFEGTAYETEKPFFGFNHILKNCSCGQKPQFRMDRRGDFYVYCHFCNKGTYASYNADAPVTDWNEGKVHEIKPV